MSWNVVCDSLNLTFVVIGTSLMEHNLEVYASMSEHSLVKNAVYPRHGRFKSRCESPRWRQESMRLNGVPLSNTPHVTLMFDNPSALVGPFPVLQGVSKPLRDCLCTLSQTPLSPWTAQTSPEAGSDTPWAKGRTRF